MRIAVNDRYSFVASIECGVLPHEDINISESFGAKLVFTWNIACIQGSILSSYDIPLAPSSFHDLMIMIDCKYKIINLLIL